MCSSDLHHSRNRQADEPIPDDRRKTAEPRMATRFQLLQHGTADVRQSGGGLKWSVQNQTLQVVQKMQPTKRTAVVLAADIVN